MSQTFSVLDAFQSLTLPPRRNVFVTYFGDDIGEVNEFIYNWGTKARVFTPKALGTFHNEDFIDSTDTDYVMGEIRRRYLLDSTVTILLVGKCTHSRRYVDWELKSSLRGGEYMPNGLLGYVLTSAMPPIYDYLGRVIPYDQRAWPSLPSRFAANWNYYAQDHCYARYFVPPTSADQLRQQIEDAFRDRTNRAHLIQNGATTMKINSQCRVCGITHPAG